MTNFPHLSFSNLCLLLPSIHRSIFTTIQNLNVFIHRVHLLIIHHHLLQHHMLQYFLPNLKSQLHFSKWLAMGVCNLIIHFQHLKHFEMKLHQPVYQIKLYSYLVSYQLMQELLQQLQSLRHPQSLRCLMDLKLHRGSIDLH